jgi:hypothetical protein
MRIIARRRDTMSTVKFAVAAVLVAIGVSSAAAYVSTSGASNRAKPVRIEVFAPERGANAGANGFGWFVDWKSTSSARTSNRQDSVACN